MGSKKYAVESAEGVAKFRDCCSACEHAARLHERGLEAILLIDGKRAVIFVQVRQE